MIERPNQVWSSDTTYIPMRRGFLYLVAVMDWYSRYVLSWKLSNSMDVEFCLEALDQRGREVLLLNLQYFGEELIVPSGALPLSFQAVCGWMML